MEGERGMAVGGGGDRKSDEYDIGYFVLFLGLTMSLT